jgi:hypothetical protein
MQNAKVKRQNYRIKRLRARLFSHGRTSQEAKRSSQRARVQNPVPMRLGFDFWLLRFAF